MSELLENLQEPYRLCKVDNGGIRFRVRSDGSPIFSLLSKKCPHNEIYKICLGPAAELRIPDEATFTWEYGNINWYEFKDVIVSWFDNIVTVCPVGQKPILQFKDDNEEKTNIGFVKFFTLCDSGSSDWIFEKPPMTLRPPRSVKITGGKLRWMPMNGYTLPSDAMIGGFENEPIYIARSEHRGSLCPGKYIPSTGCAYIAWGRRDFCKEQFEILCGFDAQWIQCEGSSIPANAFIGGTCEIDDQPLYIGRALINHNLICGKVNLFHGACYIPYKGRQIERKTYEILVSSDVVPRSLRAKECSCLSIFFAN